MRIGVMGGTFDPIHLGHLIAAEAALNEARLDEVWFVPSFIPPHKTDAAAAPQHRLEMVRRAVRPHPSFRVSDIEIRRGGPSYTLETVKQLQMDHPGDQFQWIIGADMIQTLPDWQGIDELIDRITFIGTQRPGFQAGVKEVSAAILGKLTIVPMPLIDISSTEIRERLAAGRTNRYIVPDSVLNYIEEHHLYES